MAELCSFTQSPRAAMVLGWPCLTVAPRSPHGTGTVGVGHPSVWVSPLQALHLLRCCASFGIAPPWVSRPWVSHLLGCCTVSLWVLCLRVSCLLGYQTFGCHASLIVVSLGIMLLGVIPPWVSYLLACHVTGYCASSGMLPPGVSCPGISHRWVLCFLEYCASSCILSLGIMSPSMLCLWVLHPWVSVLLECHASRDHASLDIVRLGIGSPQVSCFWLLYLWVPLGITPLGTMPLGTASPGTTPLGIVLPGITLVMVPGRAQGHPWPVLVHVEPSCLGFPLWWVVAAGAMAPSGCVPLFRPRLAVLCPLPARCWCGVPGSGDMAPGPLPWPVPQERAGPARPLGLSHMRVGRALCAPWHGG